MPGLECYPVYLVIRLDMLTGIIFGVINTMPVFVLLRIERRNSRIGSGMNLARENELSQRSKYSNHRLNYTSNVLSLAWKII